MMLSVFSMLIPCLTIMLCRRTLLLSRHSDLNFNLKKFIHLSFKSKLDTTYTISNICIPRSDSHKDLGIVLSEELCWDKHHKTITARAYKVLGRTLSSCHSLSTLVRLYISLVRLQLLYCTQIMASTFNEKYLEHRKCTMPYATKFILNDVTKLAWLNLSLMYLFEFHDNSIYHQID